MLQANYGSQTARLYAEPILAGRPTPLILFPPEGYIGKVCVSVVEKYRGEDNIMIFHASTKFEIYHAPSLTDDDDDDNDVQTCDNCDNVLDHGDEVLHVWLIDGAQDVERFFCERWCHDEYMHVMHVSPEYTVGYNGALWRKPVKD